MIAIIDYGVGNLFSLSSSLRAVGAEVVVTDDREILKKADRLILPGVGAFADAAAKLRADGLDSFVREQAASGKPLLGICLGMQLLFEKSYEFGEHQGLGLIPGEIVPMQGTIPADLKIPQIGWNSIRFDQDNPFLKGLRQDSFFYFVHSYYALPDDPSVTAARCTYMIDFAAALSKGNVFAAQFHPEKSQDCGLAILRNFVTICGKDVSGTC